MFKHLGLAAVLGITTYIFAYAFLSQHEGGSEAQTSYPASEQLIVK